MEERLAHQQRFFEPDATFRNHLRSAILRSNLSPWQKQELPRHLRFNLDANGVESMLRDAQSWNGVMKSHKCRGLKYHQKSSGKTLTVWWPALPAVHEDIEAFFIKGLPAFEWLDTFGPFEAVENKQGVVAFTPVRKKEVGDIIAV